MPSPVEARFDEESDQFRLFDRATGEIATNSVNGTPVDGGGHGNDRDKANRQARHINRVDLPEGD